MFVEQTTDAITSGEIEAGSFSRDKFNLKKGSTVFILCENRKVRNRLSNALDRLRFWNARIYTADARRGVVPSNHPPCSMGANRNMHQPKLNRLPIQDYPDYLDKIDEGIRDLTLRESQCSFCGSLNHTLEECETLNRAKEESPEGTYYCPKCNRVNLHHESLCDVPHDYNSAARVDGQRI